jgi:hypothetical protein
MSYPRQCPFCEVAYAPPFKGADTIGSRSGGRADPVVAGSRGTILHLSCRACSGRYWWDFFANALDQPPSHPAR